MMRKMMISAAPLVVLLSGVAMAQGSGAQTGLVIGGQLGYAQFEPQTIKYDGYDANNGGTYGGAIIGYDHALSPMLSIGIESGLNYGHQIMNTSRDQWRQEVDTSTLDIPVMGTVKFFPTEDGFNVFAKFGVNYSIQTTTDSIIWPETNSDTKRKWVPIAAACVGYQINAFNIFAQYTYVFGKKWSDPYVEDETVTMYALTAGVTYTIPM